MTLPVSNLPYGCWIHHNVCNEMESALYNIIKLPGTSSIYHVDVRNTLYGMMLHILNCTAPKQVTGHNILNEYGTCTYWIRNKCTIGYHYLEMIYKLILKLVSP